MAPAPRRSASAVALATLVLGFSGSAGCRREQASQPPPAASSPAAPPAVAMREGLFAVELSCAIVEGGRVWCGDEGFVADASEVERLWEIEESLCMASHGQVRCLHPSDPLSEPLPSDAEGFVITPAGLGVRDIAWTMGRQCAVDGEGVPWCRWMSWDEEAEQAPLRSYPLTDIVDIEMGDEIACMRSGSGEVHCMFEAGMIDIPELDASLADLCAAVPTHASCSTPLGERADWPAPFRVLEHSRDLALGASHACLVDTRGTVGCLTSFALPNAPMIGSTSEFASIPGLPPIVQIDASNTHVCALAEAGEVWCFGENTYGQLGDGSTRAHVATTPVLAGRWPDASSVSVGFAESCVHTPRETLCWGWIGEQDSEGPTQVPDLRASELRAAEDTTCARTDAGWRCFGGLADPLTGAVGATELRAVAQPQSLTRECSLRDTTITCEYPEGPPFELHDVIDVAQGLGDVCALRKGEVFCFSPQVPEIADPAFAVPASTQVGGDGWSGCVLDERGKPHCWHDRTHALTSPTLDAAIVELAIGIDSCGLDEHGKVQCWSPQRVTPPLPAIVEVASSALLSCARDAQGLVWCWGRDLTHEDLIPAAAPVVMKLPESAQIVAGSEHLCSRSVAGEVHCWGSETASQRGRINPNLVLRPTKVDTFTPR